MSFNNLNFTNMRRLLVLFNFLFLSVVLIAQTETLSLKDQILGGLDFNTFLAALFFSLIGVTISLLIHSNSRDQNSTNTPVKFNWAFLFKDNWKRILLSLMLIIVTLRFLKELTGLELNMFYSLCIGLVYDKLSEFIKSKSDILKVNR